MTDGFGAITWWGFSPALDLQDEDCALCIKNLNLNHKDRPLNILLIGAGDLRHVMTTIARSYRHAKRKIHFYVLENNLELYARAMLFMTIALEPQIRMGLQEKTELFLELYGNILVRKQSAEYVERISTEFIKMVTDSDYQEKKLPILDLSQLKFKERDFLEAIFKFWRTTAVIGVFEVSNYWDLRQRKLLGTRYDVKKNVYDWDYQMRLAQREADVVNVHEYKSWRETGVAFEVREADYDVPNKTMASGLKLNHQGENIALRGYWGDIQVSPYVALGIQCEDKSFFQKANKQYVKSASHIAEFNIMSAFHEIATKTKYVLPTPEESSEEKTEEGPKITEIKEEDEGETSTQSTESENTPAADRVDAAPQAANNQQQADGSGKTFEEEYEPLPVEDVKITFMSIGSLLSMGQKSKYKNHFQIVYFSNSMVHLLQPGLSPIFANHATVLVESARYMLELKLEQVKMFVEKVEGLGKEAGCKEAERCDPETANLIKMKFERPVEDR